MQVGADALTAGDRPDEPRPGDLYRRLARLRMPVLVLSSRDGADRRREDALFLKNALPAAALEELDPGGIWAPWLPGERFATQLSRFLLRSGGATSAGGRSSMAHSVLGAPAGWVAFTALAIGWALAFLSARATFRPEYMGQVLPLLLASLVPLLWFVLPRGIPPGPLFRLNRGGGAATPLGVLAGLLFGGAAALGLRLLAGDGWPGGLLPPLPEGFPPAPLGSLAPGAAGRPWLAAAVMLSALPSLAFLGNLLRLRRAPGRVLLPALLFALLPPFWPDVLWKLPLGLAGALLFARSLSFWPPLGLIAAFELAARVLAGLLPGGELPPEVGRFLLERPTGPATALLLAGLGVLCLLGSPRSAPSPARLYPPARTAGYRWHAGWGVLAVILSTLAAAVLVVGFLQVAF